MDKRLAQLKEAKQRFDQNNQIPIPKIQRVPKFLRQNDRFAKYCTPKIISFGPIHHGSESLKEGEHCKLLWTSIFIDKYGRKIGQDADQACQRLFKKIEDNIEELKNMFTEDAIGCYTDNDLAWMLFVDGCSLLHFMENFDDQCPDALNLKFDLLMHMWRDVLLLENQLPSKMLEILCKEKGVDLDYCFSNYHTLGENKRRVATVTIALDNPNPFHILDSFRSVYLSRYIDKVSNNEGDNQMETQLIGNEDNQMRINTTINQQDFDEPRGWLYWIGWSTSSTLLISFFNRYVWHSKKKKQDYDEDELHTCWNTYKCVRDLKKTGIRVMANKTDDWSDISFTSKWFSGELRLPMYMFDHVEPYFFRNLIAYEMCPDVRYKYECCSFFSFMDSLIDDPEDVKELRLAGVFQNFLGSDEELAKLFNELGDDLPTNVYSNFWCTEAVAFSKKYIQVRLQIEKHYASRWKIWLAQAYNTHFNTPWAMVAFLAASLALVLTFIQTWFAVHPK